MTDHPSNAEKFDRYTDNDLRRLHDKLQELQAKQETETRRIQLRQVDSVMRARQQKRAAHDMARHDGNDAA